VGTDQTPQTPPRTRTPPAVTPTTQRAAVRPDAVPVRSDQTASRPPYLRMAFANPYNLSLLGGGLATALLTGVPILGLLTLGLEGLWLLHAPDSRLLQKLVWDPQFERLRRSNEAAERMARMQWLDRGARARVDTLVERQEEIQRLAAQNPSFARDLLRTELSKTSRLVDAFLEMSLTCQRYQAYLDNVDPNQLNNDRKRYGAMAKAGAANDPEAQIAQKNLDVTDKRLAKLAEIKHYLQVAKGQLDLIENSFQLLVEQIVTMQSPRELSGQLDELLDGVEAIREATTDTDKLLGPNDNDV